MQKKLDEIKEYQILAEQWMHESAYVELDKSSPDRREVTSKFYENHFKPRVGTICRWDYQDLIRKRYVCSDLEVS